MKLTVTDFQKLTTEAGHNAPIIIRDRSGKTFEISRLAFEQIHEIVGKVQPATLETGHETIEPVESTSTQFVIEIDANL